MRCYVPVGSTNRSYYATELSAIIAGLADLLRQMYCIYDCNYISYYLTLYRGTDCVRVKLKRLLRETIVASCHRWEDKRSILKFNLASYVPERPYGTDQFVAARAPYPHRIESSIWRPYTFGFYYYLISHFRMTLFMPMGRVVNKFRRHYRWADDVCGPSDIDQRTHLYNLLAIRTIHVN